MKRIYWKKKTPARLTFLTAMAVGMAPAGCLPQHSDPKSSASTAQNSSVKSQSATSTQVDSTGAPHPSGLSEHWFADFLGNSQVGWTHIQVQPVPSGAGNVEVRTESQMTVSRFGATVSQSINSVCVGRSNGSLISFETRSKTGNDQTIQRGSVENGKLIIVTESAGASDRNTLDWQSDWGGFYAAEQSLVQAPMKPGEGRQLTSLVPVLHQSGQQTLRAIDWEKTDVMGSLVELLRISAVLQLGTVRVDTVVWADRGGNIVKSQVPSLGQVSYRTTREKALGQGTDSNPQRGKSFDLGEATLVRVQNPPHDLANRARAKYRVSIKGDANIKAVFATDAGQKLSVIDEHSAELEVRPITVTEKLEGSQITPPTESDRQSNPRIQSDDPLVAQLAKSIAANSADPIEVARELEAFVKARMRPQNFAPALASAATVAKSLQGDCTEYSVLLAALCRQRDIPARVAVGLVYSQFDQAFAYHMWNEVWIGDRWIGLDGTRGTGSTSAGYLKLAHSSLQSGDEATIFLPVFQVMGNLEVQFIE